MCYGMVHFTTCIATNRFGWVYRYCTVRSSWPFRIGAAIDIIHAVHVDLTITGKVHTLIPTRANWLDAAQGPVNIFKGSRV